MRDEAPITREQWLLPLLIALLVAGLELTRLLKINVPGSGALVMMAVIFTAYRAGIVPAMIGAGCLSLFVIHAQSAGFHVPSLGIVVALFGSAILIGWLSGKQRRALQEALGSREQAQRSESRYRDLVDGLDAVVWEADAADFRVRFVSRRAEVLFGYSVAEWVGSSQIWRRLIHPDDQSRVLHECQTAVQQGRDHDLTYRAVTRFGHTLHIRDLVQLDRSIHPPLLRGIIFDVSRERLTTIALEDTERRLRAFINNAPDALLVYDGEGRIVEANQRACDSLGYSREHVLEMHVADIDVKLAQAGRTCWAVPERGTTIEGQFRTRSGATMPVEVAVSVWETKPQQFIALARDITKKQQLEEQLRASQRMEAVGRLAGGIAHDFNNLLTAIRGHADLLRHDFGSDAASDLEQIVGAADRAAGLTRQLLAFSRQQMLQLQVLDLNAVVAEMQKLFARIIGENISLITTLDPTVPPIEADRTQLEQVVMNLVLNARDAMPDGGKLTIRTANAILTEVDADRFSFVVPGNYVLLSVSDTGNGMAPEIASRIFDPFFTTKEQGKGSGLGLATAYGIIRQLEGYIRCESKLDEGTHFRVYLPPAKSPVRPRPAETPIVHVQVRRGDETILVVEDEPAVRSLVRRVLQKQGYRVIAASNGAEALRMVGAYGGRIHLLLTDVVMPEMGGHDLAERLAPERPDMKILYMSGYAEDAIVVNHVLQPGFAFLPKPFAPDTLAAKVRETLES